MKKSTTGLLIGSALVVGLSGCASSASQSSGQAGANSGQSWYQHPAVCGLAGSIIGGSIGYATSSSSDEDAGAATGAAAGAAIGGLLCADRTPEPVAPQCPSYGEVPAGVAVDAEGCPLDSDGDGVGLCDGDCSDSDAALESYDLDGDGFGGSLEAEACEAPEGTVADSTDCDDGEAAANPDGTEICDGLDNDGDGEVDAERDGEDVRRHGGQHGQHTARTAAHPTLSFHSCICTLRTQRSNRTNGIRPLYLQKREGAAFLAFIAFLASSMIAFTIAGKGCKELRTGIQSQD